MVSGGWCAWRVVGECWWVVAGGWVLGVVAGGW